MLTDFEVRVTDEIEAETVAQIGAAADFFNTNRKIFNARAFEIVQISAAAKNALAQAIGMSPDYVDNCAHAHELMIVLEAKQDELEAELGGRFRRAAELPEPIIREVAKCFCARSEEKKLNLAECYERLKKYTQPREDGKKWNVDLVRDDLPHTEKDSDYLSAWRSMYKSITYRLINAPSFGVPADVYKRVSAHLKAAIDEIMPYLEKEG